MIRVTSYSKKDTNENVVNAIDTILDRLGKQGKITSTPNINGDIVDLKLSFYVEKENNEQVEKIHMIRLPKEHYDFYKSMPNFYENIIAYDNGAWAKELIDDKIVNHYEEGDNLIVEL